jgi:hypothetical protein
MNSNQNSKKFGFPDPLVSAEIKKSPDYGLKFAKAIMDQWGDMDAENSLLRKRHNVFNRNKLYANGTQDTTIYTQLLTSLDPNNGDGSFLNLDFTPVPILPKFVRIVVNKILSKKPYPNLEAVDPLSSSEKDMQRRKVEMQILAKEKTAAIAEKLGKGDAKTKNVPETLEEAQIFADNNIKSSGEIAAQIATSMTLEWNEFDDNIYRRSVLDLVRYGIGVVKRNNDPNYGIVEEYVDPDKFIHSYTEDPNFSDLIYAGHIKTISISELRRIAAGQLEEEDLEEIAKSTARKKGHDMTGFSRTKYDEHLQRYRYGYDEYMVDLLDFEFKSVDCLYFESKESKYGNMGFYFKGDNYKKPENSVFEREVSKMENEVVYGGTYIINSKKVLNYGLKTNMPKNIHDLSRVNLSYFPVATNLIDMIPKSMVDSCIGFADQLQLTHLKIQQAIAKAKPDGLIIDIEGLENVQLGKGGELQPLDLQDIYEQTGVFYYRSKNPEGGFQNPPIREIGNSIRNINEFIALYNHYLRLIRDTTGINEMMDGSTPKGDTLVGVQQQAIAAGNNAIYDITNAAMVLFKKVSADIVKCLQVIPRDSILYKAYENAIGKENSALITSFNNLPLYNFGVTVRKEMEDQERMLLEQNIQISLSQRELDLEDAIAIRQLRDINQAERLLIVRRKKRMAMNQQAAMQNSQMQAQIQQQSAAATSQARMQELQMEAQIKAQMIQLEAQMEIQVKQAEHQMRKEIEMLKAQALLGMRSDEKEFKEKLEVLKEDRKDVRVDKQAAKQSKLISQRKGERGELPEVEADDNEQQGGLDQIIEQLIQ